MAFDGITVQALVSELRNEIVDGRISKIAQPEADEILLTIKGAERKTKRLLISANASLPLVYLTDDNKISPLTAPNFCMLLRKYISGAKIVNVTTFGMERVINIELYHLDEMGDYKTKYLIIELMGKHSNIIFCEKDEDDKLVIIDAIKRISGLVSSVREVLPKREYFIPNTMDKCDPFEFGIADMDTVFGKPCSVSKAIYSSITGFSKTLAVEICVRCNIDSDAATSSLTASDKLSLFNQISNIINDIKNNKYDLNIAYSGNAPLEYAAFALHSYDDMRVETFESASVMISTYYSKKEIHSRINQKSYDLRRIVKTNLERNYKKLDLQEKQFKKTFDRDKYRIYGELLTTYGYQAEPGAKSITCVNYYDDEEVTIPLDPDKSPIDNAKRYFERYNKLKRTYEALVIQIEETKQDIEHLESISNALDIATSEGDLALIKEELKAYGYIKKGGKGKKEKERKPKGTALHYISSDGFDIYVGKNNYQNDELTFSNQGPYDWWFHAKGIAGSHVVLRGKGPEEIPDRAYEEAGALAAYYSKGKNNGKVEIDYTPIANIKKPKNAKPGFVVYYTNYSLIATTDIDDLTLVED